MNTEFKNPRRLLQKYFADPLALAVVTEHSKRVAEKAVAVALALKDPSLDVSFVEEAALLHDIGICRIDSPEIGCHGEAPYICHGIIGRSILEEEGLIPHALVCERHIGVGLTVEDIVQQNLPLPHRDMVPLTLEEQIVCYADLFFSKKHGQLSKEKSAHEVRCSLTRFAAEKADLFDRWHSQLAIP